MMNNHFADIILPLAVKGTFTYSIPVESDGIVIPGVRVLVPFGKRMLYTGIVTGIHDNPPSAGKARPLMKVLDTKPFANEIMLKFWSWIAEYYLCSLGEVMKAAIPSVLCPAGDGSLPVVEKYRPRVEAFIQLAEGYSEADLCNFLDKLAKAPKQQELLNSLLRLSNYRADSGNTPVRKSVLLKDSGTAPGVVESLVKKGILTQISLNVGRLDDSSIPGEPLKILSPSQEMAIRSVNEGFKGKGIVLLHGVTSSGKTEIYIHLIEEQLERGKQVLYLLPEIGLTAQIILRLRKHFGRKAGVYHSRFNDQEKAEIWNRVADDPDNGYRLIIGVRSSLFLPFSDLGLIIVDEEQDSSYKQHDPAPRYNARDSAIILARLHGAKILLGSASPSIESYYNAMGGKYTLVELKERYGSVMLPGIIIANTREAYRKKLMVSHFTPELIETIDQALSKEEQVILFQNRRGFSPYIECPECGWIPRCIQCAVNLTYHKGIGRLVCHYCGYTAPIPSHCGNCGSAGLVTRGFGTEKIEDEIKIVFPAARVARMDHDTTRGKSSFDRLIGAFEERQIDIMIGTQMISKGLDFENLTVVGILNADNLLNFPDFRAHERGFQLMEQVSGRAGRRNKPGKVVIQTSDPGHKIIRLVLQHDYRNMFRLQADERREFNYPPFSRMIKIIIKHKDRSQLNTYAEILGRELKSLFGKRVLGPEFPIISQVQQWYIKTILVKLGRDRSVLVPKQTIVQSISKLEKEKGASSLRIAIDVDPY